MFQLKKIVVWSCALCRSIVTRLSIVGRSIKECVYAHTSRCVRCHRCRQLLVCEVPQDLSKCSVSMTVYAAEIKYFRRRWSNRDRTATRWRAFILFFFLSGCCWCCAALRPRYKRLVDNIFPVNPQVRSLCLSLCFPFSFFSYNSVPYGFYNFARE